MAQNRMQHIWNTFIDGVKILKDIALCLNEPIFDQRRLQKLSKNAEEKLNLAEQDINNSENAITHNINRLVLKRQEYENEMKDLNSKIISLSYKTSIEENEVRRATDQVRIAERQVEEHTTKEFHALLKHELVTGGTNLLTRATVNTLGSKVGVLSAKIGRFTTKATQSNLQNVKKAADEERMELQEKENKLRARKAKLNRIIGETDEKKFMLNGLEINRTKLLNELKLLTKQKSFISQCHDYINITLGRVEILNERRKIKILIVNLKESIEKVMHAPRLSIMTENVDSTVIIKKLNTGIERKDLMVSKIDSICNWEHFLMPAPTSIAMLGQLMAVATKIDLCLDTQIPEATEGELLDQRRRRIDEDCKKAKAEIQALAEKSRKDLEQKVKGMYERLEEQLNKLPLLPQAKVQEIKENVEKSSVGDYV
ncbi:putative leucine-rich repeat-containing protein DDB_G0290503 [Mytilus edulis]|uniref:putative leucine-rich repeat-containing protein DDB_G0290503 n=1 Tax=Mytilus edulis TaxID=6550 RepID=UPI0039EF518A